MDGRLMRPPEHRRMKHVLKANLYCVRQAEQSGMCTQKHCNGRRSCSGPARHCRNAESVEIATFAVNVSSVTP